VPLLDNFLIDCPHQRIDKLHPVLSGSSMGGSQVGEMWKLFGVLAETDVE
jgi:hypothetical protein